MCNSHLALELHNLWVTTTNRLNAVYGHLVIVKWANLQIIWTFGKNHNQFFCTSAICGVMLAPYHPHLYCQAVIKKWISCPDSRLSGAGWKIAFNWNFHFFRALKATPHSIIRSSIIIKAWSLNACAVKITVKNLICNYVEHIYCSDDYRAPMTTVLEPAISQSLT